MTPAGTVPARTRLAAVLLAAFALAGCESLAPSLRPDGKSVAEQVAPASALPYPSFGAPKQIGDRPVLDPAGQAKMQSDLEGLAKQRESDAQPPSGDVP